MLGNIIVVLIVLLAAFISIRKIYKTLTGKFFIDFILKKYILNFLLLQGAENIYGTVYLVNA